MSKRITGIGVFGWPGRERRSDRYGLFTLHSSGYDDQGSCPNAGWSSDLTSIVGVRCSITAKVLETRTSGHIGDLFRGIIPTTPSEGEIVELGIGVLFVEQQDYATGVGLLPDDGRSSDWFDPNKLYRLHDQTVEIMIMVVA